MGRRFSAELPSDQSFWRWGIKIVIRRWNPGADFRAWVRREWEVYLYFWGFVGIRRVVGAGFTVLVPANLIAEISARNRNELRRPVQRFLRPSGLGGFLLALPTACAVGCNLSPLRGWQLRSPRRFAAALAT